MGESKTPFKTNVDQKLGPFKVSKESRKTAIRKPIKAVKVDVAKEKSRRIKWLLTWVLFLPLGAYALLWLLVLLVDLFKS